MTAGGFDHELADRVSFDLTYRRAPERRMFTPSGISGGSIDAASGPGQVDGGWSVIDWSVRGVPADGWLREFFAAAVTESVHEALEWFQVDDAPFLDPHGVDDLDIDAAVREMADVLFDLAERRAAARRSAAA